jgi:hypothetical protein
VREIARHPKKHQRIRTRGGHRLGAEDGDDELHVIYLNPDSPDEQREVILARIRPMTFAKKTFLTRIRRMNAGNTS